MVDFTERYSRQIRFQPIGKEGQQMLSAARVAIVGLGALGTVLSSQLARAGVGYLRLIDRDVIEVSNLQRQLLYTEQDAEAGRAKAEAAAEALAKANSQIQIEPVLTDVTAVNAEELLGDVDVIVDGTDNLQVRYLINDVAVKHGIPWSYGGAVSSYGTTVFIEPGQTPCLVCLFGADDGSAGHDTCDTVGVLAPIVSMIASMQVAEIIKFLTGNRQALKREITYVDIWQNEFRSLRLGTPKEECICCQKRQFLSLQHKDEGLVVSFCGRQTIQIKPQGKLNVSLAILAERLKALGRVQANRNLLRFETSDCTISLFADGRALIHGVDDIWEAKRIYAQYIGL
ncbi:ThiF family adenylyltransferase [Alicyclobacillus tolerans]|uniref:ThiF family adenylyltransferase n=1 Tax=Alicyclobacillus tolerans TaxID=90970 RepID=UPI003B765F92